MPFFATPARQARASLWAIDERYRAANAQSEAQHLDDVRALASVFSVAAATPDGDLTERNTAELMGLLFGEVP